MKKSISYSLGIIGLILITISLFLKTVEVIDGVNIYIFYGKDFQIMIINLVFCLVSIIFMLLKKYYISLIAFFFSLINVIYVLFKIKEIVEEFKEIATLSSGFYLIIIGNILILISVMINYSNRRKFMDKNKIEIETNEKSLHCKYICGIDGFISNIALIIEEDKSYKLIVKGEEKNFEIHINKDDISAIEIKKDFKIKNDRYYEDYNSQMSFNLGVMNNSLGLVSISALNYALEGNNDKQEFIDYYSIFLTTNEKRICLESFTNPYDFFDIKKNNKEINSIVTEQEKSIVKKNKSIKVIIIILIICGLGIVGKQIYDKMYLNFSKSEIKMSEIVKNCINEETQTCDLGKYLKKYVNSKIFNEDDINVKSMQFENNKKAYNLSITVNDKTVNYVVKIIDDFAPIINCSDKIILGFNEKIDGKGINVFDYGVEEFNKDNVKFDTKNVNYEVSGEYTALIIAKDSSNNESKKEIKVEIKKDEISLYNYITKYINKYNYEVYAKNNPNLSSVVDIDFSVDKDLIFKYKDIKTNMIHTINFTQKYIYYNYYYIYFNDNLQTTKFETPRYEIIAGKENELYSEVNNQIKNVYPNLLKLFTNLEFKDLLGLTPDECKNKYYKVDELMINK